MLWVHSHVHYTINFTVAKPSFLLLGNYDILSHIEISKINHPLPLFDGSRQNKTCALIDGFQI